MQLCATSYGSSGKRTALRCEERSIVAVIDVRTLIEGKGACSGGAAELNDIFSIIFGARVILVGFGIRGDIVQLLSSTWVRQDALPALRLPFTIARTIDLQEAVVLGATCALSLRKQAEENENERGKKKGKKGGGEKISLVRLVAKVLHRRMSKEEQVSNWQRRPLSPLQLSYAALDAEVLVRIIDALLIGASPDASCEKLRSACFPLVVEACTIALSTTCVFSSMVSLGLPHSPSTPFLALGREELDDSRGAEDVAGEAEAENALEAAVALALGCAAASSGKVNEVRLCKTLGLVATLSWSCTEACALHAAGRSEQRSVACVLDISQRLALEQVSHHVRARALSELCDVAEASRPSTGTKAGAKQPPSGGGDDSCSGCGCARDVEVRSRMVSRRELVQLFGYRPGGLGPCGLRNLKTMVVIDTSLLESTLLLGAGESDLVFAATAHDLVACGLARVASIAVNAKEGGGGGGEKVEGKERKSRRVRAVPVPVLIPPGGGRE